MGQILCYAFTGPEKLEIYGNCPVAGEIQTMGQVDIDKFGLFC